MSAHAQHTLSGPCRQCNRRHAQDLTALVEEGKLDPDIGRDSEWTLMP